MSHTLPKSLLDTLTSPALIVDIECVRANIQAMISLTGNTPDRWRPHLKTTKLPDVWTLLLEAGVRHVKVSTSREATVFLELVSKLDIHTADLLVAHPLQGPALQHLGRLAAHHPSTRVSVLSEDPAHVASIPESVGVFVDINVGMDRTGIAVQNIERVLDVARAAGERFRGLHGYEGHVSTGPYASRRSEVERALSALDTLVQTLEASQISVPEIITSGTPSFYAALELANFSTPNTTHRVSPGTLVFFDGRSAACSELAPHFKPAAMVFTRVVSHPRAARITTDAGSKSLAAEVGVPCVRVHGQPHWQTQRPSEEHLPIDLPEDTPQPALGSTLMLVPEHVCPTVNLAEMALLWDGTKAVARPVSARAHDMLSGQRIQEDEGS